MDSVRFSIHALCMACIERVSWFHRAWALWELGGNQDRENGAQGKKKKRKEKVVSDKTACANDTSHAVDAAFVSRVDNEFFIIAHEERDAG